MKIMICGSATFAKELLETKKQLEKQGHKVLLTDDMEHYSETPDTKLDFEAELKMSIEQDVLRQGLKKVAESDAILVLNHEKNGIKGYLGPSVIMELGLAYHLNKKIFLLNKVDRKQSYALEIELIKPTILEGELTKIR
jgi:hypothetical protein